MLNNNKPILDWLTLIKPGSTLDPSEYELVAAVGDLPRIIGEMQPSNVPPLPLQADKVRSEAILNQGRELARPWIGITYAAGLLNKSGVPEKKASIEALLKTLPDHQTGTLFVVQRDITSNEVDAIRQKTTLQVIDTNWCTDLNETLSMLDNLDHYVGVSNTNMHLRASLNKSATMVVTTPEDFRWAVNANDQLIWFPTLSYSALPIPHQAPSPSS